MTAALPCVVVGGYLGAGKTTLVNHLLRHAAGRRIAVLVNDFGELPIDADLIEGAAGDVLQLAGGCVCCSYGSDLIGTLSSLAERCPRPDVVLLECSGVADPAAVARSARLLPSLHIDGVVVVADAETLRRRADDPYVGDTVRQQLAAADLLVLNKSDLLPAPELPLLLAWAQATAARARCVVTERAQLPMEAVLGLAEQAAADAPVQPEGSAWTPRTASLPAAQRFDSVSRRVPQAIDVAELGRRLAADDSAVLRAKGVLTDLDGRRKSLHVVGRRVEVAEHGSDATAPGSLVVIGLHGRLDPSAWL